jgi:hypothetical protein
MASSKSIKLAVGGTPQVAFTDPVSMPDAMRGWGVNELALWALAIDGIIADDENILVKNRITGADLLDRVTEEKLERWGMPGGPAGRIMSAVAAFKSVKVAVPASIGESSEASRGFMRAVLSSVTGDHKRRRLLPPPVLGPFPDTVSVAFAGYSAIVLR